MKEFFEYFYYRFAQKNFKKEGSSASTAILGISIVQFLIVLNILMFLYLLLTNEARKFYLYEKIIFGILFFGINYYNYKLYNKRYFEFRERWKDETLKKRKLKWAFLIFVIISSWCLIFINGWIFDRFK